MTPTKHREYDMSSKLLITELNELSVSKLILALAEHKYSVEELGEAIQLELDGQKRSTALEALKTAVTDETELNEALAAKIAGENRKTAIAAITDATELESPHRTRPPGLYVCKGKAVTTKAGMKSSGDEIKEGMIPGESADKLLKKGFLEVEE